MGAFKWVFGGLGFWLGGPIGAAIGYSIGRTLDGDNSGERPRASFWDDIYGETARRQEFDARYARSSAEERRVGFWTGVMVLFAAVINADGQIRKSEIESAKKNLREIFADDLTNAQELLSLLQKLLRQPLPPLSGVVAQIHAATNRAEQRELLYMLLQLAAADGEIHAAETAIIEQIAAGFGFTAAETNAIKAMFVPSRDLDWAYQTLDVSRSASDAEVKSAYRRMAQKHHPDKVARNGKEAQQIAVEKFKKIRRAYEQIQSDRQSA